MNFQDLKKVENAAFYLDLAFKRSRKHGDIVFPRTSGFEIDRIRRTESEKVREFHKVIEAKFDDIIKKFPSLDNLPEFYQELVRVSLDYDYLKKSLGTLGWATKNIASLSYATVDRLKRCNNKTDIKLATNAFYGRTGSIMRQIDKNLNYIDECRNVMQTFPNLKTDLFTVAITGFPNIGKSTLLSKLTPAKPKIQDYAFTTKNLNQGYATYGARKVQYVDTPGVLNRGKMNPIEMQAYLVLKYLVNLIVYVIDLTEPYPLKDQHELLKVLKDYEKPMIIYLSKADILDKAIILKAKKKYKAVSDVDTLIKKIEIEMKKF